MNNRYCKADLKYIIDKIQIEKLRGKSVLVTGATGLIGSWIIYTLNEINIVYSMDINILALVRNVEAAKQKLGNENNSFHYVCSNVEELSIKTNKIDFIIHAASITGSSDFVKRPMEVISVIFEGTRNVLELAKRSSSEAVLFLSSMEVYGAPENDVRISENSICNLDTMSVRSSYPESKRMAETLCAAYWYEYHVPTKVIRLTQTIGPGVPYKDGRVFAEFARSAVEQKDIVLLTEGKTRRSYLDVKDAVTAIFTVLLFGNPGEAYNAANEETYCSIRDMAEMVATEICQECIKVVVDEHNSEERGFAPVLTMNLNTSKLKRLGWEPSIDLYTMLNDLIDDFRCIKC